MSERLPEERRGGRDAEAGYSVTGYSVTGYSGTGYSGTGAKGRDGEVCIVPGTIVSPPKP